MKLRLQIATAPGCSTTFEHAGPVVRIGRDSTCELALEGEAARQVSREHARIELAPDGATLRDAGSSNGTLLNDRPIEGPQPLREGDRIQLGYTGATLTVVDLDLTPPASPAAGPALSTLGIGAGAIAGCVLLFGLAFGVVLLLANRPRPTEVVQNPSDKEKSPDKESNDKEKGDKEKVDKDKDGKDKAIKPPSKPVIEVGPRDGLSAEVRDVGQYVRLEKWGPSVLLARQGEAYPWAPLRREVKVATAHTLVGLPGYRSVVALDSGVELTLWGNVPEFSAFPPVLESVVMLNVPAAGTDLDLTLDHGRVMLANRKKAGPAQVRLRFLREVWDLTLPEPGSEVGAELWGLPRPAANGSTAAPPALCLGLFTKGPAAVQTAKQKFDLKERMRLAWLGPSGTVMSPVTLPQLPDWWVKPPDRANPQVADVMLSLLDWSNDLARTSEVFDTILTRVREPKDPTQRVVGLLFLAALDGTPYLVDFLEDRQHPEVRGTAAHALRCRLARGADQPADLADLVQKRRGYAKEKAALIVQLLQNIPEGELARAETYQKLIDSLDHENLAVRDLAYWHLALLVPEGARKILYNPTGEAAQRHKAIDQWKQLVPAGKVPTRPMP